MTLVEFSEMAASIVGGILIGCCIGEAIAFIKRGGW